MSTLFKLLTNDFKHITFFIRRKKLAKNGNEYKTFLAPTGAQEVTLSVCLPVIFSLNLLFSNFGIFQS